MDKREHDDSADEHASKRVKNLVSFRFLIPANAAGSIIGKGGENIKSIRSKCGPGAYLRVPESSQTPERLILVTCDVQDIQFVVGELTKPVFKALAEDSEIPENHKKELILLISSYQAGYIVGRGGTTTNKIRSDSGCSRFKVYKDRLPLSEERVVEIQGDKNEIAEAVRLVLEILAEHPLEHEIVNYAPSPYQSADTGDFGGYKQFKRSRILQDSYQSRQPQDSYQSRPQQDMFQSRAQQDSYNSFSSVQQFSHENDQAPSQHSFYPAPDTRDSYSLTSRDIPTQSYPQFQSYNQPPPPVNYTHSYNHSPQTTRTVLIDDNKMLHIREPASEKEIYIDDCYTGHVIGSKGAQIAQIRHASGATVKVADNDTVRNNERQITITGTQTQISRALELINQAIVDKNDRDKQNNPRVPTTGHVPFSPQISVRTPSRTSVLFDKITAQVPFVDILDSNTDVLSDEIYIDNALTAPIIGPRGSRISEVRKYTECHVNIENDDECQGDTRKVTMRGTPRQIHLAKFMIEHIPELFNRS